MSGQRGGNFESVDSTPTEKKGSRDDGRSRSTYGWHWGVKCSFIAVALFIAYVGATAPGKITLEAAFYAGILAFGFGYAIIRSFKHEIVLTSDAIHNRGLLWTTTVRYEEIGRLDLSDPTCMMKVIRSSNSWATALKVYPGIGGWQELIAEVAERAPNDVEVLDPFGRLGWMKEDRDTVG
jgi:hypothetical protein